MSRMLRRLLCRLGLHKWGHPNAVLGWSLAQDPDGDVMLGPINCAEGEEWCYYCSAERVQGVVLKDGF
jgi:hypothetical protein